MKDMGNAQRTLNKCCRISLIIGKLYFVILLDPFGSIEQIDSVQSGVDVDSIHTSLLPFSIALNYFSFLFLFVCLVLVCVIVCRVLYNSCVCRGD